MAKRSWNVVKEIELLNEMRGDRDFEIEKHDEPVEKIHEALNDNCNVNRISTSLRYLSAFHAANGICSIFEEPHGKGWSELHLAWQQHLMRLRIIIARHSAGRRGAPPDLLDASLCLAAAISFREDAVARWCFGKIANSFRDGLFDELRRWGDSGLFPFLLELCGRWLRRSVTIPKGTKIAKLGPYKGVISSWNDPQELGKAIGAVCDYHVESIMFPVRIVNEFIVRPYDVFPTEVIAIYRVRNALQMETPSVDHPLLDSPLFNVPDNITPIKDALLTTIEQTVKKELPEFVTYSQIQTGDYTTSAGKGRTPNSPQPKRKPVKKFAAARKRPITRKRTIDRKTELEINVLREVLSHCGLPKSTVNRFKGPPEDDPDCDWYTAMAYALDGSSAKSFVSIEHNDPLQLLYLFEQAAKHHKFSMTVDERDGKWAVQFGKREVYVWKGRKNPNLNSLAACLGQVLSPRMEIYRLFDMDGRMSDAWGYVLLPKKSWTRIRRLLGAGFGKLFVQDTPKGRFEKS